MARFHRMEDDETPSVEAAEGFERYYGDLHGDDRTVELRDARRDEDEAERRKLRQMEREGRL